MEFAKIKTLEIYEKIMFLNKRKKSNYKFYAQKNLEISGICLKY